MTRASRLAAALSLLALAGCVGYGDWSCDAVAETCNGFDDDCDGMVDLDASGDPLLRECSTACGTGQEECVEGAWAYCSAPQPMEEACNGIDDDCDGELDEGCDCVHGTTRRCSTGERGDCADGMQICDSGAWSDCVADGDPSTRPETCDGRDNDCDGEVDEGLECPFEAVDFAGHTYLFCTEGASWQDAVEACTGMGYDLVSIESAEENDFVGEEAWTYVTETWWTGLNDRAEEGVFRWSGAGTPVTFTSWADGEPNDANGEEDCVTTDYAFFGGWNDDGCAKRYPFVCESD